MLRGQTASFHQTSTGIAHESSGAWFVVGFEGSLSMCPTIAKTIKKRPPPPAGGQCRHGRDDRVAQEGTAGDRAVVQERIDEQCLIESARALGG